MSRTPIIETSSPTWRAVKGWAEERLDASRTAIEPHGVAPERTEYERGRIAALRELLQLPEPRKLSQPPSAADAAEWAGY